jgi:hypothetical protein
MNIIMLIFVYLFLSRGTYSFQTLIQEEFKTFDSISFLNNKYLQEINDLKIENNKLRSNDTLEKIIILIMGLMFGGVIRFLITRFNQYFENILKLKREFKTYYESFKKEYEIFEKEYSKVSLCVNENINSKQICNLNMIFNNVKEFYKNESNFTLGEYNSTEVKQVRNYFSNEESSKQLIYLATKSIEYYNYLYMCKIDKAKKNIVDIFLKMKVKANKIM